MIFVTSQVISHTLFNIISPFVMDSCGTNVIHLNPCTLYIMIYFIKQVPGNNAYMKVHSEFVFDPWGS